MRTRKLSPALALLALAACAKPTPPAPPPADANAQFASVEHEYVVFFMQQFPVVAT